MKKILSICIPTYNRSIYLDKNLNSILENYDDVKDEIDIYVHDNDSSDNTIDIIKKYKLLGLKINFHKHSKNIGTELNFLSLYNIAKTHYLWILCDDDYITAGSLKLIINCLRENTFSIVYLNNIFYHNDLPEVKHIDKLNIEIFDNPKSFIQRVHFWITFLSGNIINKTLVNKKINLHEFEGTMLNYLTWHLQALCEKKPLAIINNICIACKADNTGGYKLFEVFGKNFKFILKQFESRGLDPEVKNIIIKNLLSTFFPSFIKKRKNSFLNENYLMVLFPIFWTYRLFWSKILPLFLTTKKNEISKNIKLYFQND